VYEYILATLATNESIPLGIVKPLYCSLFHMLFKYLSVNLFTLKASRRVLQGRYQLKSGTAHNRF
jgi:hypothetical protein